jgi:transmembrane sensor
MQAETSREIDAVAADWVARLDRGALAPDEESRLETWLDGDMRRRGAFMRMSAIAVHSERAAALGPGFDSAAFRDPPSVDAAPTMATPIAATAPITRRRALWFGGSAAAACAAGAVGLSVMGGARRYDTRLGEVKVVTLEDGSVMTLNTSTAAAVRFDKDRRLIALDGGEALFDVAKNRARPFLVRAGDTQVRAVGTSFTVKHLAGAPVEVLVSEGVVEVSRDGAAPVRVTANMRMVASGTAQAAPAEVKPAEIDRELAWKSGRVALAGESLAEAAEIFARYSDTRIVLADASVGKEVISGLFTANDPVTFAKAAAASLDLKAQVGDGAVTISR